MSDAKMARQAMRGSFALPDEHSFGVYKALKDVYPAFAKKLFENNALMQRLIMSGYNPMDILDYPICDRCETITVYNGYAKRKGKYLPKATCVREGCGHTTVNPIILRHWIQEELKNKVDMAFFESIEHAVDGIAASMLLMYTRSMRREIEKHNYFARQKMGLEETVEKAMADNLDENLVEHMGQTDDPGLPEDRIEIQEELEHEG